MHHSIGNPAGVSPCQTRGREATRCLQAVAELRSGHRDQRTPAPCHIFFDFGVQVALPATRRVSLRELTVLIAGSRPLAPPRPTPPTP
jgi:hypothetical protein